MIYAGILAAGIGERMHRQDLPKQFLNLGSKPILIHTLEQFYINHQVERLVVVAPDDWRQYTEDLIRQYNTMNTEVSVISGGENKTVSIQRVVEHIKRHSQPDAEDILIAHDAVRPFVTQRMIEENIAAAREYGAAVTVMTTNDTIVVSDDGEQLSGVPEKAWMFAEQTPMTFRLKLLADMLEQAEEKEISLRQETELVRLFISLGYRLRLVKGEYSNMKIINPFDLEIAEALLGKGSA